MPDTLEAKAREVLRRHLKKGRLTAFGEARVLAAMLEFATPATEQPGGEGYRAGVAAGLEKAAGIAERQGDELEAEGWLAADEIAAAIRQEIGNG